MSIKLFPPHYLFPTKILMSEDSDYNSYKENLIEWMRLYSLDNETVTKSNNGGYQSPDNFYLERSFSPYMNRISELIVSTINYYIDDEISQLHENQLSVSNMWFNINYKNSYNVSHTHPGCVLAGVFWVQCPQEVSPITFNCCDDFARATYEKYTSHSFDPKEGQMVLFPAHVPHRVDINHTKQTRISIAFNLWAP